MKISGGGEVPLRTDLTPPNPLECAHGCPGPLRGAAVEDGRSRVLRVKSRGKTDREDKKSVVFAKFGEKSVFIR